ncbi:hypothetical protein B7Z17_03955, partial [Candidatus Saccharibacteria bacterium 32-49-10]
MLWRQTISRPRWWLHLVGPRQRALLLAISFTILSSIYMLSGVAQAAVQLRASSDSYSTDTISYRNSSSAGNAGATTVGIAMPTGVVQNDVMVAAITFQGGTGVTVTPPTGWNLVQRQDSTTTLGQALYWKLAAAGESGTYTWTLSKSRKASGVIMAYSGVNTASPIDISGGQANASSATITAPSVTTTVANDMLVGFFGENAGTAFTATTLGTSIVASGFSTGTGKQVLTGTGGAYALQAAIGASGTKTATTGTTAAVNIGQLVALKPGGTSLTLNKPAGTAQNDVLVAALTTTGSTTITAPAGWASIQRSTTAA